MKTHKAPFAQTPKVWTARATAAFALTGAGSLADSNPANTVLLDTPGGAGGGAGTEGSIIVELYAMPQVTVTATLLVVFSSKDNGATKTPIASALMAAHTVSATTAIPPTVFKHANGNPISETEPLRLEAGEKLYFGVGVAPTGGGIVCTARPQDY